MPPSLRSTFPTSTLRFPRFNQVQLCRRTPTQSSAIVIGLTQNAAELLMSRRWRIYKGYVHMVESVSKTDNMAGSSSIVASRSARHLSRMGSLLCCTSEAEKPYAPRHSHTMLFSAIILPLQCRQGSHSHRLSRRSSL